MVRVVVGIIFLVFTLNCLAKETETRLFRPFTEGAEHAPFKIKEILKGNCFQQSKSMRREDAWRCLADSTTYDPCFKKPGNDKLMYCPQSPWDGDSTVIKADMVVENEQFDLINMADNLPWVLLLDNGVICKRTFTQSNYDQQPIEYECQDRSFLFGRLQRCRAQWSMLRYDGSGTDTVEIKQAWY